LGELCPFFAHLSFENFAFTFHFNFIELIEPILQALADEDNLFHTHSATILYRPYWKRKEILGCAQTAQEKRRRLPLPWPQTLQDKPAERGPKQRAVILTKGTGYTNFDESLQPHGKYTGQRGTLAGYLQITSLTNCERGV
jgi:hypothetical protein